MSRDWSWLRRIASTVGAVALLQFVGAVAVRGPSRREAQSPVYLSRASGQAEPAGATNAQRFGDTSITGPFLATSDPASFDGDLAQLPQLAVVKADNKPELEISDNEKSIRAAFKDTALQAPAGPSQPSQAMPGLLQDFPGLNFNDNGAGWPPDINGDVGPNDYVQVVNTSIGIFSKTGTLVISMTLNTFFQNAPAPCDTNNNGDPVVLYDAQADRWVVSDFSWTNIDNGPHYECIAASKTGDPAGAWWYYALRADDDAHPWLNDYPKLGVWSDGLYMSANMFQCSSNCSTGTFEGARVWAISPTQLYNGSVLTTVVFQEGSAYFSLLPSNFRGARPPVGTPNYFVSNDIGVTALDVFKFQVNWTFPLSSTFAVAAQVAEAGYTAPPSTVPVLSGNAVDSLNDRLMMQNQYRNISGTESLWLAHTADDPTGIRWYQLDVTSGTVPLTPTQQSTYAPADGLNRWMPSLAVDKFGNMAVGYSTSSAGTFPDIRYAGRLASDPPNTLGQDETTLISGTGAQNNSCGGGTCIRWGDYSAMTVDPMDDCTFWYTTEYYTALGGDWQTRIGSFRFPICGSVPPPLTLQAYLPAIFLNDISATGSWNPIMQESFEGAWPSGQWQVTDPAFAEYLWGKSACRASSGASSAWAMGGGSQGSSLACGASYINDANSWMIWGPFSLANATAANLTAQLWLKTETGPSADSACLMASTDGNTFYTDNAGTCFSGDSGGFMPVTLNLNDMSTLGNLDGQSNVWIAIIFQSDASGNMPEGAYVDDLLLQQCTGGACAAGSAPARAGRLHGVPASLVRPANVRPVTR